MYDVIVIGARCAGSPIAMLLARRSYRVLLVDRATFPSDVVSTHYIQPPGVELLARWGLLNQVVASKCPPISRVLYDVGGYALCGFPPCPEGVKATYCPRRIVLDKLLLEAAVEAGVEFREGIAVRELVSDGDRITGIRYRNRSGQMITETATLVIGSDGMHSMVARWVGAAEYNVVPPLGCSYYTYWSDVEADGLESYPRPEHGVLISLFPTHDNLACIFVAKRNADFAQYRADVEGVYHRSLRLAPGLAERVAQGRRQETFRGMGNVANFFRKCYGPGWALAGDAAYHKDPITAQGITDAFCDAQSLADAIDAGLSGHTTLLESLAAHERNRDARVLPMYDFTCWSAALEEPTAQRKELYLALRDDPGETDRFFGTLAGTVSIPEFFASENMSRILASRHKSQSFAVMGT
jgi:2-polyprenyl-6-methoxyphenol hydroxylase-like FAD-dependent oxidoreductase